MKITSSKRDNIIRRRDEYDARINEINQHEAELDAKRARDTKEKSTFLENKISEKIGNTTLQLEIRVDPDYVWDRNEGDKEFWRVSIRANERNKFSEDVALSWNMEIKLGKSGDIVKESSSWSGLKAITPAQIADLEESVRVIKILNAMDWTEIVKAEPIRYSDYRDAAEMDERKKLRQDRPDFESELRTADLEEFIGTNTAVEIVSGYESQYYRAGIKLAILPTKDSAGFITGYIFPQSYVSGQYGDAMTAEQIKQRCPEGRVRKDKLKYDENGLITIQLS